MTGTPSGPIRDTGTWEGGPSRPSKNTWRRSKLLDKKLVVQGLEVEGPHLGLPPAGTVAVAIRPAEEYVGPARPRSPSPPQIASGPGPALAAPPSGRLRPRPPLTLINHFLQGYPPVGHRWWFLLFGGVFPEGTHRWPPCQASLALTTAFTPRPGT